MGIRFPLRAVLAAAILLAAADPAAADPGSFLVESEDVPLMPGLVESHAQGVLFDTPEGRIVEAHAEGLVAAGDVEAFYAATLPQLGWTRLDALTFRRETELLRLETSPSKGGLAVRFVIHPAPPR